ncbi:MAG: YraN family protein [Eubacteriales bacterium]
MDKRKIGAIYEKIARTYIEEQEATVCTCNYHCRFGEIDLIVYDEGYLVFVEVKYRKNHKVGYAQEAVDDKKQKVISKVASYYCISHKIPSDQGIRFDVIGITGDDIEWIKNAFDYVQ